VQAGSLLVGVFRATNGLTVSDNLNGTWTEGPACGVVSIWYKANAKPGATTVTLTAATADLVRIDVAEYSGAATANPLDAASCSQQTGAAVTIASTAAVPAGELAFAGAVTGSNPVTVTAGSINGLAATLRTQMTTVNGTIADEDVTSTAPGQQNASMTLSVSGGWSAAIATFRAPSDPPASVATSTPVSPVATNTPLPPTSSPVSAPISFVQGAVQVGNGSSLAVSYAKPVQAGSLLVGVFRATNGLTVRDNLNGTWTEGPACGVVSIWYKANAKPGTTTVTLTAATADLVRIDAAEYAGVATANPLDAASCSQQTGAAVTIASTAAVPAGELAFAGAVTGSNPVTVTAGNINGLAASLRTQMTTVNGTIADEDVTSTAPGQQNASMTLSVSGGWSAAVATFKANTV
jgi:hypothetical protein